MKIIKYFFLLLTIVIISCTKNPYEVEDMLYQCMVDKYAEKNVDLDLELKNFETYLIDEQILESKSGESYQLLFDKMIDDKHGFYIDWDRFEDLRAVEPNFLYYDNCLASLDTSIIVKSKYYELKEAFETRRALHDLSDKETKVIFNNIISEVEYGHSFYRTRVLLKVLYVFDVEAGIPTKVPGFDNGQSKMRCISIPNLDSLKYIDHVKMNVSINDFNQVFVEDKLSTKNEFDSLITFFVLVNAPKYQIILNYTIKSSFELYIEVRKDISQAILKAKNIKSLEIYGVAAKNLEYDDSLKMNRMFRKNIAERWLDN